MLPEGFQAGTGDATAARASNRIDEALSFVTTFLLVFAGVALTVGAFLIVNTFSILVAQRSRELALLRAIGASRRQVARSVLLEAGVVGLVGSAIGLGLGFVLAVGIKLLFGRIGLDLSANELVLQPRTVVVSLGVGLVVTLAAAYLPARRAGRVPPVAAMRDDVALAEGGLRWRIVVGLVLLVAGHRAGWPQGSPVSGASPPTCSAPARSACSSAPRCSARCSAAPCSPGSAGPTDAGSARSASWPSRTPGATLAAPAPPPRR